MVEIDSAPIDELSDDTFAAIMSDIERRRRRPRLAVWLPVLCLVALFAAGIARLPPALGGILVLIFIPSILVGYWIDSSRRNSVLTYDLDEDLQERYARMCDAFDELRSCAKAWHVSAAGNIRDYHTSKRNAGAKTLVNLRPTVLRYRHPKAFKSNIIPPSLTVGRQTIFLFPDVVLVEQGRKCGGVRYLKLDVTAEAVNHVEEGMLPSDAQIVAETWRYPNKSGGPDRRFKDNRRVPICRYEMLAFESSTGISEILQFSRVGPAARIAHLLTELRV